MRPPGQALASNQDRNETDWKTIYARVPQSSKDNKFIENIKIRNILKELLTIETNFDVVKLFIDFEPSITKSKYITKFLNSNSNIKLWSMKKKNQYTIVFYTHLEKQKISQFD